MPAYHQGRAGTYYDPAAIAARQAAMEAQRAPTQSTAAHVRNPAYMPWLAQQQAKLASLTDPMQRAQWIGDGRNYAAVAGLTTAGNLNVGDAWKADLMTHGGGPNTQGAQGPMTGYPSQVLEEGHDSAGSNQGTSFGSGLGNGGVDIGTPPVATDAAFGPPPPAHTGTNAHPSHVPTPDGSTTAGGGILGNNPAAPGAPSVPGTSGFFNTSMETGVPLAEAVDNIAQNHLSTAGSAASGVNYSDPTQLANYNQGMQNWGAKEIQSSLDGSGQLYGGGASAAVTGLTPNSPFGSFLYQNLHTPQQAGGGQKPGWLASSVASKSGW